MDQWTISLIVADGPNEGDVIPVASDRFFIGRRSGCHFRPTGEDVADLQCAILSRDGRFFLRNLCQPGGTYVGGRQVLGGIELRHGDRFQAGSWHFQARIARRSAIEPAPCKADVSVTTVPASAVCDIAWSTSLPAWTSQIFVGCNSTVSRAEEPTSAPAEQPVVEEPSILAESELLPVEEAPALDRVEPASSDEEWCDLLPAASETEVPVSETSEAGYISPSIFDADLPEVSPLEESGPGTIMVPAPETMIAPPDGEECYVPLSALEDELGTAQESATPGGSPEASEPESAPSPAEPPPVVRPRYLPSSPDGQNWPGKAGPPPPIWSTGVPTLVVGRADRSMTTLRQLAWNAAMHPPPPPPPVPPKAWKTWVPALGGIVVGMLLVGVYLVASAAPPRPLRAPPRGILRTGRAVVVREPAEPAPPALGPVLGAEPRRSPQSDSSSKPPPRRARPASGTK